MIFWRTFLESIKLPSKQALFKLNRTGMDTVVIYIFILLLFVSIPSLLDQILGIHNPSIDLSLFFLIIYFFIFYYLPLNVLIFILLSVIAFIALGITKLMKRKLRFAILWKMTAYTTTLPFLLYTVTAIFFQISDLFLWLSILYTFILLMKMISIYPKRRVKAKYK